MDFNYQNNELTIFLKGRIDTNNANDVEKQINDIIDTHPAEKLTLDAADLMYISSAGLRVVLRLRRAHESLSIINVSPDVYEIFEMTGFTEMVDIKKAYRVVSVEGCEVIGKGANGVVYQLDPETIVKVYLKPDALEEIHHERELARKAFVAGIPTAISYDVVRVGTGYGSVFEMLNAKSYAKLLNTHEKTVDEIAKMSIDLLKLIHSTIVQPDELPDIKPTALKWAREIKDQLPDQLGEKLYKMIEDVEDAHRMMHGDYHIKNVMLMDGESMLIDMDTLCQGHPVFELGAMYNAYIGFASVDQTNVESFLGISYEDAYALWKKSLALYFEGETEEFIRETEKKIKVIGLTHILSRTLRHYAPDDPEGQALVTYCKAALTQLVRELDTLMY